MNRALLAMVCALGALGCGGDTASLTVTVSGEEAAVEGFDESAFVDGWRVDFEALVVSITAFGLHGQDGEDAMLGGDPVLVDVHQGDRAAWTFEGVSARRWDDVRYRIAPATADARDLGAVDPRIRQRMIDEGLSIYVEATATKGELTRRIEWAFDLDVGHSRCEGADGTDGIIVATGAQNEVQITTHWDHLFFDSLALDDAEMRFEAIAAAGDDVITLEDLSSQRLANLRGLDGEPLVDETGAPIVYDPGSFSLAEPTLRGMVEAVTTTVGHLDGEGHCEYSSNL